TKRQAPVGCLHTDLPRDEFGHFMMLTHVGTASRPAARGVHGIGYRMRDENHMRSGLFLQCPFGAFDERCDKARMVKPVAEPVYDHRCPMARCEQFFSVLSYTHS